ncbi:adenosylcobinamide-GDP ribazoletransferase [Pseudooceanicola onchidii]|uniref:adenosylcobinamide-GDP ribazoletransferase n=1 Tax=Pseudooceanicola onchidii TaxID=2562279 RepID=UPI0010A9E6C8|nr:adenosylcobinamide-GDP ribazoletransferase [Pseudooceanicola onchidii]
METAHMRLTDDILTGFGLLTRLPLPDHTGTGARAAWSWPLTGLVVGGLAVAVGAVAMWAGLSAGAAAVLMLVTQVMATGGLHEDGLADTADGLWGGWTRDRRLEIMRDSRIGSYGVIALVLALLLRWTAVVQLIAVGHWGVVVAAAVVSRGVLPGVMALVPNARQDGLSRGVGRPTPVRACVALVLALALALLLTGDGIVAIVVAVVLAWVLVRIAVARIGGQTGDILGAIQVVAEIGVLLAL